MSAPQAPQDAATPPWTADLQIDITGEICPMTFVRTRLALDRLAPGAVLGVLLRGAEPARNVPETARLQGHRVLDVRDLGDGTVLVAIRKKGRV